jgi:hypothetical protein
MRVLLAVLLLGCPPAPRALPFMVQTELSFANEMGASFKLRRVTLTIDKTVVTRNQLDNPREVGLGAISLSGGEHDLTIETDYQGHGYGVFSYLSNYRFKAHHHHVLELPDARPRRIRCIGYEAGGPTTPIDERAQIRCETTAL